MRTIFRALIAASLTVGALGSFAASANADASIRAVCAPPALGHASCLGLRLVMLTPTAQGATVSPASATPPKAGLSPAALHKAYGLPLESAEPQTIAIVDAFDDPNIAADLAVFEGQYGVLPCGGCFTKVNQLGQSSPLPESDGEWSTEIATDVEVARSVCQNCHILLVEANTASYADLEAAEETAAAEIVAASKPGKLEGEISNSWGGSEPPFEGLAFNHPGIVITASAGDAGYLNWEEFGKSAEEGYFAGPDYPASSPRVVAVGGTSLARNASGEWAGESVWNDSAGAGGGGCSEIFAAPSWQAQVSDWAGVGCGSKRAVADVAADADPFTGVDVYDSTPEKPGGAAPKWLQIGGTSVASPIIASIFALAGGAHGVAYPASTLYYHASSGETPSGLHDVVAGGNGECDGVYTGSCSGSSNSPLDCGALEKICNAAPGYDGPTGVGSPNGLAAFLPPPASSGNPGGSGGSGSGGSGSGSGSGGSGSGASGSGSGASGSGSGSSGGSTGGGGQSPPGSAKPGATSGAVRLTRLSLTLGAVIALNRGRSPLSRIAFTFALSRAATVRVTLARRIRVHGHWRWSALRGADIVGGRAGANRARLSGRGVLPSGFYRLTLTPAGGAARSLAISIG